MGGAFTKPFERLFQNTHSGSLSPENEVWLPGNGRGVNIGGANTHVWKSVSGNYHVRFMYVWPLCRLGADSRWCTEPCCLIDGEATAQRGKGTDVSKATQLATVSPAWDWRTLDFWTSAFYDITYNLPLIFAFLAITLIIISTTIIFTRHSIGHFT